MTEKAVCGVQQSPFLGNTADEARRGRARRPRGLPSRMINLRPAVSLVDFTPPLMSVDGFADLHVSAGRQPHDPTGLRAVQRHLAGRCAGRDHRRRAAVAAPGQPGRRRRSGRTGFVPAGDSLRARASRTSPARGGRVRHAHGRVARGGPGGGGGRPRPGSATDASDLGCCSSRSPPRAPPDLPSVPGRWGTPPKRVTERSPFHRECPTKHPWR
jgi:hypothetical protein